jgi:protein-L-isoaspartate(D-aspartate) O-methyltransferase
MTVQSTIPDFVSARRAMIESQLRPEGVTDAATLDAMAAIPREQFVPEESRPLAYADRSLAIGGGRFLLAPAVLGKLLNEMSPVSGERALVIGAGTGYSAAVLAAMGCEVLALEGTAELAARARKLGIKVVEGTLAAGHDSGAPYDLILIDGAVELLPDAIIDQLGDGGRLGAALVDRGLTRLVVGHKVAGGFGYLSIADAGVAPLPGFLLPRPFTFER